MKKIIHINQHVIKQNIKSSSDKPCITIKTYKDNRYAHEALTVDKDGNTVAKIVSNPKKPLSCGARCWVETDLDVQPILRGTNEHKSTINLD